MQSATVVGIDVSKDELVVASLPEGNLLSMPNRPRAIKKWLSTLAEPPMIGVESTGSYHEDLVQLAHSAGCCIYLLDARRLNAYRKAMGVRAKTDRCDAELIAQYVSREHLQLHAYCPPAPHVATLQRLLRRRARVVQARVRLESTLKGCPECRTETRAVMRSLATLLARIDARCEEVFQASPESAQRRDRLRSIPGVGQLSSIGLHVSLARTPYRNSDALIAGLGLDPRPNDSGQHKGRRRLTKRGPSELRRLLYLAAVTAVRYAAFRPIYLRARSRGLGSVASLLTVARKIARIAFAIDRAGTTFDAAKLQPA